MIKKYRLPAIASFITILAISSYPTPVLAGLCPGGDTGADFSGLCGLSLNNLPGQLISVVFVLAIIAALAYLIWGGVKWIISGGDKTKVDDARKAIVAAIVGLVLVFLSYFIISIVVPIFVPGFNLQNLALPSIGSTSKTIDCPTGQHPEPYRGSGFGGSGYACVDD